MLRNAACGFGYLALAGMCGEQQAKAAAMDPLAPKTVHHAPKAKRVIFLFMHGGPSHLDTFDYKPELQKKSGIEYSNLPKNLRTNKAKLLASPWKFAQHGKSGMWVSSPFPNLAKHVDDMTVIRSMHTDGVSHGQAVLKLHTGSDSLIRPSMGSWILYGLGTENRSLPGFVTICPTRGHGGVQNYSNAFLPAVYQGTALGSADVPAAKVNFRDVVNKSISPEMQRRQLDLIQAMNRGHKERAGNDDQLDGVIQSFELAFRMQSAAPSVMDISGESADTLALYGINQGPTDNFGRQCLLARRFAEAGVRFIQVSHSYRWDQHSNMKKDLEQNASEVDLPMAGLLTDLKNRGLLDDTLVVWGGEFGRTPTAQGNDGRDHNPFGFTMWLAGGGVKRGYAHGQTDEIGFFAAENKVHMHDLHATILHLLGLDHQQLTYRHAGRDFRLTDVYGRIVNEIIA